MILLPEVRDYNAPFILGVFICDIKYNGYKLLILCKIKENNYSYFSKNLYDIIIKDNIVIKNDTNDEYFKEGKIFTDEEIAILNFI